MLEPASTAPAGSLRTWSATAEPPAQGCAWCGARFGTGDTRLPGRIRCSTCGVATTSPWPTDEQLETAYGPWYRPEAGRFSGLGDALLARTRATLARRIDSIAPPGQVLDVGAGDGTLVAALQRRGRDAVGLERHADADAEHAHLRSTDISEVDGQWAAVVFWHSLEHLPQPKAALAYAANLLAPGGLLVVALPNAASRQAHAFGERWLALDLPRHLVHVPADALLAALAEVSLRPTRVSHTRGGQVLFGWSHGLVGALPGHPDLYDAIRTPQARSAPMTSGRRAATLLAAAVTAPVAIVGAAIEVASRRGGSVYVEARR